MASSRSRVLEITLEGFADHVYRLTVGALPYVTGWWPLVAAGERGEQDASRRPQSHGRRDRSESRRDGRSHAAARQRRLSQPRDHEGQREHLGRSRSSRSPTTRRTRRSRSPFPPRSTAGSMSPTNSEAADVDLYRFDAEKGQQVVIETRAAMLGSPADTKIEVLDAKGVAGADGDAAGDEGLVDHAAQRGCERSRHPPRPVRGDGAERLHVFQRRGAEDLPPRARPGCGHGLLFERRQAPRLFQHQPRGSRPR